MLTKQFWRNQNSPNSLLARTFKAKYFPRTHLQGYIPKLNHSRTWKNIAKPQYAELGKGRWLFGSGHHQIPLNHPDWFNILNHILRDRTISSKVQWLILFILTQKLGIWIYLGGYMTTTLV